MPTAPPHSSGTLPPWAGQDGEWLRHPSWETVLAELPDPSVGRAALDRLRDEFPPAWSLATLEHPVRIDSSWLGNRPRLLEMGHVLATQRCGRVRDRLRDPNGYSGVQAELRGGALLAGLGATLTHEPRNPKNEEGRRPDWRAVWSDGSVHVEVKLSHTSQQANAREVWSAFFSGEFQNALAQDVREGDGLWATLHTKEPLLDSFGRDFNERHRMQLVAHRAAAAFTKLIRIRRTLGTVRGRFTLTDGCEIELKARTDGAAGLTMDGHFYVSNMHRITLRLRGQLKEASEQLDDMPGARVVLLDTSQDSALRRPTRAVRALLAESWAERIAAVMIVYRNYPHCIVEVVGGRALDALPVARLIEGKLRPCNRGHEMPRCSRCARHRTCPSAMRGSNAAMPKCLYCHEVKDVYAFNREHVIPEAFGTFEPRNMVLKHVVCETCNRFFGDHLELRLSRDSVEGLDRYEHGLKKPDAETAFGRAALLRARVRDGGFYDGAQVWWGPSDDGKSLVLRPAPQIGISDQAGKQVWFVVDELPAPTDLEPHGFARGTPLTLKPFGIDPAEAEGRLREKGYTTSSFQQLESPPPGQIDVRISGVIDRVLMRAIAKIAFNYLAYHYEGIARMEQFDSIRRYIRLDHAGSMSPVSLSSDEFLAGLPPDRAPVAHGVGVSWNRGRVVGQVTLFFRFHYRVVLADGGFLFAPTTIGKGHLFNPIARQIVELTPDPRRGRPIKLPPREV